jgi:hypothetical protein
MKAAGIPGTAALLTALFAGSAPAAESYYMLVFGSQLPTLNRPNHTHSFAAFVRATGPGCGPQCVAGCYTISWMPRTLEIRTHRLLPECGVNLDLHATLRWALHDCQRVSVWGPYQIRKELFDQALRQVARLQSGEVRYKAVDTGHPTRRVSNCFHALSDLAVEAPRLRVGTPGWGESASYFVALTLSPWILDPGQTHDWVLDRLGLGCFPLVRRDLSRSPTENPLLRAVESVTHRALLRLR